VTKILPARRQTDPPALAAVGPSLLRRLPRSLGQLTEKAAVQTVRTVALIGGDEALKVLAGYVGDERTEVIQELVRAWGYFDAEAYAECVLSRLPLAGREVQITHTGQLHAARRLRSLTAVHITCPVRGLEFLAELPPLKYLWASDLREEVDLSPLRGHPDLEDLMLFGNKPLRPGGQSTLSRLTQLKWLAIPLPGDLELNTLHLLPKLRFISLSHITAKTDLSPLTHLPVHYLHLSGIDRCAAPGFDELEGMASLESLYFYEYDVNKWLTTLKSAPPSLTALSLHDCIVPPDRHAFTRFKKMKQVHISDSYTPEGKRITSMDFQGEAIHVV
jgi:hypothetical protein